MNRDFKGIWIPREIWLNKNLSIHAKLLWAEISSLHDRESGGCYASNEYLCEFMGLKISRLKEVMKELRDAGLLTEVSFNGRHRVIRAENPTFEYGGQQIAGKPASSMPENRPSPSQESGSPPYIDTSVVPSVDLTPPTPLKEDAAKAAEVEKKDSPKAKREKPDFSPKVREIANLMVNELHSANPHWLIPKNLHPMMVEIEKMLLEEKREPKVVIDVFMWSVSDSFWMDKLCKPNPAKYLRSQFGQLAGKMNAKPPKNGNEVDRRLRDSDGSVVDGYKDRMF